MLTTNPFAELSATVSPGVMVGFVLVMILLVILGTLYDVMHKKSARYFFETAKKADGQGTEQAGKAGIALQTALRDVATSAEFCNPRRRIAHLLGMYGFVLFVLSTVILVSCYTGAAASGGGFWAFLWYLGAVMICVGGYWFWFFIRADVSAEGGSPFRLMRADLFILSLLGMATFGLLWAVFQYVGAGLPGWLFFGLFLIATVVLFAGVPWSKFAHMFFKPAAAFQKRVAMANGSAMNLPTLSRDAPEQQQRHSMQLLRDAPMDMGLGIKREAPRHY